MQFLNKLDIYCLKDSLICLKEFLLHRSNFISLKGGKRKMYYDYTKIMNTLRTNYIICHILKVTRYGESGIATNVLSSYNVYHCKCLSHLGIISHFGAI